LTYGAKTENCFSILVGAWNGGEWGGHPRAQHQHTLLQFKSIFKSNHALKCVIFTKKNCKNTHSIIVKNKK